MENKRYALNLKRSNFTPGVSMDKCKGREDVTLRFNICYDCAKIPLPTPPQGGCMQFCADERCYLCGNSHNISDFHRIEQTLDGKAFMNFIKKLHKEDKLYANVVKEIKEEE